MDMSTFVYVGDYSTACACKPRVAGGATSSKADADAAEGAVLAAAAGVEVQRQQAEDAAGNQNQLTPGAPPRY
jgi:hypothetical protein